MEQFVVLAKLVILSGTLLSLAFLILLALPKSYLRAVCLQVLGWAMVAFCILYGLSPADLVPEILLGPFGLVDDVFAVAAGVGAASVALRARKECQELKS